MPHKKTPRILVVNRDLDTLTSLDFLLTREGYRVTLCSSLSEALRAIARRGFDLVIAGTREEEGNGLDLVWKIEEVSPGTRVVLLLEPDCGRSYRYMINAGADGLLMKPYTGNQLTERVERLLA